MIKVKITETGRGSLNKEASIFNWFERDFSKKEEVIDFLKERYGKVPKGKNKIYIGAQDSPIEVGFTHSYWNEDISHNSDKWFQTDWIEIYNVELTPIKVY